MFHREKNPEKNKIQRIALQGPYEFESDALFWNITDRFAERFHKAIQRMLITMYPNIF